MRQLSLFAALAAFQACARAGNVVVESLRATPEGWRQTGDADPNQQLTLRIALAQPDADRFEETLYEISDPQHPLYGQHLGRDELADMMRPRDESTAAVRHWLSQAGISSSRIEDDGEWINFRATVSEASSLLDARFAAYTYLETGTTKVRALSYSVPEEVAPHIIMIAPVIRFGQPRPQRSQVLEILDFVADDLAIKVGGSSLSELDVAACNTSITPDCLRALYKVGDYQAATCNASLFGITGYLEQYAKYEQLELFSKKYAPYAADANFSVVGINGGRNDQTDTAQSDVEANLDMQYGVALSYNSPVAFYSTGGRAPLVPELDQPSANESDNEPYLDFLTYMLKLPDSELPQTLSTSYGEDEQSVPKLYAQKVCQMFGQLGARGVSVIFSSGDAGAGSSCLSNDGKNTTRFLPIFPAACPYVTSVGGTQYVEPEQAVSFSSGGFSDYFARPSYQTIAVSGYLAKLGDRWAGMYNRSGRGFPDVAAQGVRFHVFDKGTDVLVSGTSASAPAFAAIVSLLNGARLANGQPPMGFLNPWLYSVGQMGLTDIVHGGSKGCAGSSIYSKLPTPHVPYAGWNATEGWDPVTGLGTPLFDQLLEISTPGAALPAIVDLLESS